MRMVVSKGVLYHGLTVLGNVGRNLLKFTSLFCFQKRNLKPCFPSSVFIFWVVTLYGLVDRYTQMFQRNILPPCSALAI